MQQTNPARLMGLMELGLTEFESPTAGELGGALAAELAAAVPWQTSGAPSGGMAEAGKVGELLLAAEPNLDALRRLKDYAKGQRQDPDSGWPMEVATVIYYACIAAALVRSGTKISGMPPAVLRRGLDWALAQSWVEPSLRPLFSQAQALLRSQ